MKAKFPPILKTIGYILLSAVLLSLSYPSPDLFPLAWIAFVPVLYSLRKRSLKSAFLTGWLFGGIFFTATLYWVARTVVVYGHLPLYFGVPVLLLLVAYLAVYFGLFTLGVVWIERRGGVFIAFCVAPFLWVLLEFLRGWMLSGFPWNLLAYSQYRFLPLIQIARLTGPYGVSWVVMAANCAVVLALLLFRLKDEKKKFVLFISLYVFVLAVTLVFGFLQIGNYPTEEKLKVALIQGNTNMNAGWSWEDHCNNLKKHLDMIADADADGAELAVLSESALRGFSYSISPYMRENINSFSKNRDISLLFGSTAVENSRNGKYYNSAFLLEEGGRKIQRYDKIHLVPFGEYVPLRSVLGTILKGKFSQVGVGDFSAGSDYAIMMLSNGFKLGCGICYEILFPELMNKFVRQGAQFLVNITNDTWYGRTSMPPQHFSFAVFRAVENGKYVVRAANSGISGIVAPDGKVLEQSELFKEDILLQIIHPNMVQTFYSKNGDWFVVFSLLTVFITLIVLEVRTRRA